MTASAFETGGFRFVRGVFQYSGGVAALPGHRIRRVRFRRPVPLTEGFRWIEAELAAAGRPTTAFCACELRSPGQFSEQAFRAFNESYVDTLARWGLYDGRINPVARSNVCPEIDPPSEPSFHAFAYTVEASTDASAPPPTFVIAGSGEAPEGMENYRDHIVRRGETSVEALAAKARFVHGEMERRLSALGLRRDEVTATQLYTVHDVHPLMASEIVPRGIAPAGLTWHYARPPIQGLEYEMDCRGIGEERVV